MDTVPYVLTGSDPVPGLAILSITTATMAGKQTSQPTAQPAAYSNNNNSSHHRPSHYICYRKLLSHQTSPLTVPTTSKSLQSPSPSITTAFTASQQHSRWRNSFHSPHNAAHFMLCHNSQQLLMLSQKHHSPDPGPIGSALFWKAVSVSSLFLHGITDFGPRI